MRVADRVDPLARVAGPVEPVRVARRHLDHALDGSDGQRRRARREELPEMPLRLRDVHRPRLEDGDEDVGREAPVAEAHHPGSHPGRRLVPVAHVRLRRLVRPAVLDQRTHRDPVRDQRDVEDRQAHRGEPERTLREALARERPADDPRQREPAESRGEQRPAADDRQVGVGEVADEVARVAGAGQVLGEPRQVLDGRVDAAQHEEEPAGHEVLRRLAVVRVELVLGVRRLAHRRRLPRNELADRRHDDGEEGDVGQKLERREVLDPHGPADLPTAAQALRNR